MHPYQCLPETAFWKKAVSLKDFNTIESLWTPKFVISPETKTVTYGSCFAQHIGKTLADNGFCWLITEKSPPGLSEANCKKFNYGLFSARTGNIYKTSLLKQWIDWALKNKTIPEEYWIKDQRIIDPFRPKVEPEGFCSIEEMNLSRNQAVESFRNSLVQANLFVFTLGLTESWTNHKSTYEYPLCPGTVAGIFDPLIHQFTNQDYNLIYKNLSEAIRMIRSVNKTINIILTVSPVPLSATNSKEHVLTATVFSKSILRAVAGQLAFENDFIDYFPSYEIITSPFFKGMFYAPDMREVSRIGVDYVMGTFFKTLHSKFGFKHNVNNESFYNGVKLEFDDGPVCEEVLLDAFSEGNVNAET